MKPNRCKECGAELSLRPDSCPLCGTTDEEAQWATVTYRPSTEPESEEVDDYQTALRKLRHELEDLRSEAEAV